MLFTVLLSCNYILDLEAIVISTIQQLPNVFA